jgi:hypothetical protein
MRSHTGGELGQTLIMFVLALGVILGFTAMAIDMGLFFEDRRHMQNAADAAALAGAAYLPHEPHTAMAVAEEWLRKHDISDDQIALIDVETTQYPNDTMVVELSGQFNWVFGRALGLTQSSVGASAKGMVGSLGSNNRMMPWALLQGDSNCLDENGKAIYGATCAVKVGVGSSAITGWYGALDYDGRGGGSAEYESNIVDGTTEWRYCVEGDVSIGCRDSVTVVDALHGNKVGGTGHGIEERIEAMGTPCDRNGNGRDDFDEIFAANVGPGPEYTVICPDSPRLIIIPIVSYQDTPVQEVTIRGWSLAYLETYGCSNESAATPEEARRYVSAFDGGGPAPDISACKTKPGSPLSSYVVEAPPARGSDAFVYGTAGSATAAPVPLAPPLCHNGRPHGLQTCSTPTPGPTPSPTPDATPEPETPTPTPTGEPECGGQGHWEVQVRLVDAVYSQASGFMTAYDPEGAITIRRLIE